MKKKYRWLTEGMRQDFPEEGVSFMCGKGKDFYDMSYDDEIAMVEELKALFPEHHLDQACEYVYAIEPNKGETFDDIERLIIERLNTIATHIGTTDKDNWLVGDVRKADHAREALAILKPFNPLSNDRDAYLYAVIEWGMGESETRPEPQDYGLGVREQ